MRLIVTLLTFCVALALTAVAAFFAVMFLAGPHGGALPTSMHSAVALVACLVVLALPALAARWVWRRCRPRSSQ